MKAKEKKQMGMTGGDPGFYGEVTGSKTGAVKEDKSVRRMRCIPQTGGTCVDAGF